MQNVVGATFMNETFVVPNFLINTIGVIPSFYLYFILFVISGVFLLKSVVGMFKSEQNAIKQMCISSGVFFITLPFVGQVLMGWAFGLFVMGFMMNSGL